MDGGVESLAGRLGEEDEPIGGNGLGNKVGGGGPSGCAGWGG